MREHRAGSAPSTPRVALLGVILESNRAAPMATEENFRSLYWLECEEILEDARAAHPVIATEASAFVHAMDATGPWEPAPVLLAASHPAGLVDSALMDRFIQRISEGLAAAGSLDAVYICNHGGMAATGEDDPDGALIEAVRNVVGATARIVVTLDLHANISDRMVAKSDLIVGYRTNPHVDMIERGEEAAFALRQMLAGAADPQAVLIRLSLTPASVNLLTADGPYGELIDLGQRRQAEMAGEILNVSLFGGFVFSDTKKNGFAMVVTARRDLNAARSLALEIAEAAWAIRARFQKTLMPLGDAVALALDSERAPVIFSDSGDNPGGGGSGRTTGFLIALVNADARDVLVGSFFEPEIARAAHDAGMGGKFTARFNQAGAVPEARSQHDGSKGDDPFEAAAEVIGLHDGNVTGRLGIFAGRAMKLGLCAALRIGGITVVVISDRTQTADPVFFEMFGLDIGALRTVVVKSRGHFRAGFAPWFTAGQVHEVDTEGLTSPVLERLDLKHLPRPVYPLDKETPWTPPRWE